MQPELKGIGPASRRGTCFGQQGLGRWPVQPSTVPAGEKTCSGFVLQSRRLSSTEPAPRYATSASNARVEADCHFSASCRRETRLRAKEAAEKVDVGAEKRTSGAKARPFLN